jgi:hypothetical protein
MRNQSSERASRPGRLRLALALLAVLASASECRVAMSSLPATRRAERVADRFAQLFWNSDDDAALDRILSSRLKLMMRTNQLRAMRDGLIKDQGRVRSLKPPWYEDSIRDYRRFRVPVEFERTMIDMRIVIDENDLVSQFFFVDHVRPP